MPLLKQPMRFVCNWSAPDAGKDPGYASACVGYMNSGKPMDQFDGFQVISRVFYPQSGGGMMLVEANSLWHVYQFTGPWTKAFGVSIDVIPALSDEEFVSAEAAIAAAQS